MKLMKREQVYRASNVSFDPKAEKAYSYAWWCFVARIEGKLVFNNYRYSVSTGKHQAKVRRLLNELGIKIDIELPVPKGIQSCGTLAELILEAEEYLCDQFLSEQLKRQEAYQRAKARKAEKKLEDYLENYVCFRDYEIKPKSQFGSYNKVAVHQIVEPQTLEQDVQNALYNFHRDGFGNVVFYV